MDIAFSNSLSIGGFRYALILVDHATQYNWAFGLKNLLSDAILAAIRLFCAVAGSLARGLTKRTLCGIVLFKLNTFLVMFLHVPSIDSTCFPCT